MSGRRPMGSSVMKRLPPIDASLRSSAVPPRDSIRAPATSSEPPIRAPSSRTSPTAVNRCSSRTVPPTRIRSAWMARSWPALMLVSRHSSRPPMSASHSQIADRRVMLALVGCTPATRDRDRSRSPRTCSPLASRPGSAAVPVRASSRSWAFSASRAESNSHPSNRSGNGTSSPARSTGPRTEASRSRRPRGSIWSFSSRQHRRSRPAPTGRRAPPSAQSSTRPSRPAARSSASLTSSMVRSPPLAAAPARDP